MIKLLINEAGVRLELKRSITFRAEKIYKELRIKSLTRGRDSIITALTCVYISAKEKGYPLTIEELSNEFNQKKKRLIRSYKFYKKFIKTRSNISVNDLINKLSDKLSLSNEERLKALKKSSEVSKKLINHRLLMTAAVTIRLTSNKTLKQLSKASGLSVNGIRKAVKASRLLQERHY